MAGNISEKQTPLMKQYNQIKGRYPEALLLFRVGDFYETFGEDAVRASKTLEIVLTKRANGAASEMALAGFPHHAIDTYLPKLIKAGYRVAICDQLEDPKTAKGIVKRGVTELVTPGVTLNDAVLSQQKNNFLAALFRDDEKYGVAFLDLSTGEFMADMGNVDHLDKWIRGFGPSEILYPKKAKGWYVPKYGTQYASFALEEVIFSYEFGYEKLTNHFKLPNLKGFGLEEMPEAIQAAGAILHYLEDTQHRRLTHIKSISRIDESQYVWLDRFTIRNLELLEPTQADGKSLLETINHTCTPMGGRLLRKWLLLPLKNKSQINERLDAVTGLIETENLKEELTTLLSEIGDLERLSGKLATRRINPRELLKLKGSLERIEPIGKHLRQSHALALYAEQLDPCEKLKDHLSFQLQEEAPVQLHQGNVIAEGVSKELDDLRHISTSGKEILSRIRDQEISRTGISSLKIAYNRVFGYYLEVSNAQKEKVPENWVRKQTLVNAERYISEELKQYEEKILTAEAQIQTLELTLFEQLLDFSQTYIAAIQENAKVIAQLDCLASFALQACQFNYTRPSLCEESIIKIKQGRHPVIERYLPKDQEYIANDVFLDDKTQQIMIITGPNMAGKSALLRQSALITLLAQMGSFVPAGYAKIGLVDKIFTRVGASDNLSRGESTFMVEMSETAGILNNLSDRSLILMDEIGRGTSTYDGMSIAHAIVEFLHNHPKYKAKTLFATHYHELNELTHRLSRVKNFNVSVKELADRIVFMRTLKEGGSEHSFGIHVAKMAGMPNEIVIRANKILELLEKDKLSTSEREKLRNAPPPSQQMNLFESDPRLERIIKRVGEIDIHSTTPVEALLKLNEIKDILKGDDAREQ